MAIDEDTRGNRTQSPCSLVHITVRDDDVANHDMPSNLKCVNRGLVLCSCKRRIRNIPERLLVFLCEMRADAIVRITLVAVRGDGVPNAGCSAITQKKNEKGESEIFRNKQRNDKCARSALSASFRASHWIGGGLGVRSLVGKFQPIRERINVTWEVYYSQPPRTLLAYARVGNYESHLQSVLSLQLDCHQDVPEYWVIAPHPAEVDERTIHN